MIKTKDTSFPVSLSDTSNLRELICDNPDLPLIVFCGDESWDGEHSYNSAEINSCTIEELTLYDNGYEEIWMSKEDYSERLSYDLCDKEEYEDMSDEEYDKMIEQKVNKSEFVKAIVIYVG